MPEDHCQVGGIFTGFSFQLQSFKNNRMTGDKERNEEVRNCPKPKWWMEKHWKMLLRKEGEDDEFTTLTGEEISLRDTKGKVYRSDVLDVMQLD